MGQKLARLPLDPRFGRMLLAAGELNCLRETLIIVSALATQDPRERPMEQREATDEKHQRFNDRRSDFLGFIKLWEYLHKCQKQLSKTKFRKLCRQEFISVTRFLEWQGVHGQLQRMVCGFGLKLNQQAADYTAIHRALIFGLPSHVGYKEQDNSFCGTRNRRFWIFPGSALYAQPPKWVMAAELAETTRLYARTVAKIEPQWVVDATPHLLKREHFGPYWQPRKAQVYGYERISLYGLVLIPRRRIHYGAIAPAESREIFIREALIAGRYPTTSASFLQHNRRLVAEVCQLEAKLRRRDILISEETLYEFYNQRIPPHIHSGRGFEHWLKTTGQESMLYLTKSQLMVHDAGASSIQNYPERVEIAGTALLLGYHFEPGAEQDGVTLTLPLALLNRIDPQLGEWLVPGLLPDKIISLIKGLPKTLRRNFIPAPDFAQVCVEAMVPYRLPLAKSLSAELYRMTGVRVSETDWSFDSLADHLKMRYKVVDADGRVLAVGRDLLSLQREFAAQASMSFRSASMGCREREGITDWSFGSLEEPVNIECEGIQTSAYPALIDQGKSVSLRLLESPQEAYQQNLRGVLRLYQLNLRDQLKSLHKQLKGIPALCLRFPLLGGYEALKAELTEAVLTELFLVNGSLPTNPTEFEKRLQSGKSQLVPSLDDLCRLLETILEAHHAVQRQLSGLQSRLTSETTRGIKDHLGRLVYPGFISNTPRQWLAQYPRYLQAVNIRLDKLDNSPERDALLCKQIDPYCKRLVTHLDTQPTSASSQELIGYRWMLEEFRVSLFAQNLGTCMPVSSKRLEAQWRKVIDGNS